VYRYFFKNILDRSFALILLILFSPIILIVSILIFIKIGHPIFFTQNRPTKDEKIFKIYKFRTMSNERDKNGELLPDEDRLIGVGKVIRSLSLDELPQLFNVLLGDMSFVGPRPLLVEYLPLYNQVQKRRHSVKAGITGLAQVNGRNAISWEQKFKLDVEYAENISFWLDLKILFLTIKKVLIKDGISQEGNATMERFRGSN
jgi:lipopolysaccharide/colanic/teichoic acid biosynthesis glycosyltransferase